MGIDSAYAWKRFYADERERLGGDEAIARLVDRAEPLPLAPGGALVVPHTRAEVTGDQLARAAATVLASDAERVLLLGVLHGARRADAERVAAARAGDPAALAALRGVHREDGLAAEEFSLDTLSAMLDAVAGRGGRRLDVVRRYPFLVGTDPASLPGLAELHELVDDGALLVATTDPIHHGHAYDTAAEDCLDEHDPATVDLATAAIEAQLDALADHRFDEFAVLAADHRSDFRDTGPVLAALVGRGFGWTLHDLALVDYSTALDAPPPSWVAGALVSVRRHGWPSDPGHELP